MNILAIDTCTEIASVTLSKSGEIYIRELSGIDKTSGHILKLCDEVFEESQSKLRDVDLISYSQGLITAYMSGSCHLQYLRIL